jgi:hypothetical protein
MNNFKHDYPDFASIESHIRQARLERSVAVGQFFADVTVAIARGLKSLGSHLVRGLAADRDRRAIEADVFLRRSIAHR